jgi:hypothetical protein
MAVARSSEQAVFSLSRSSTNAIQVSPVKEKKLTLSQEDCSFFVKKDMMQVKGLNEELNMNTPTQWHRQDTTESTLSDLGGLGSYVRQDTQDTWGGLSLNRCGRQDTQESCLSVASLDEAVTLRQQPQQANNNGEDVRSRQAAQENNTDCSSHPLQADTEDLFRHFSTGYRRQFTAESRCSRVSMAESSTSYLPDLACYMRQDTQESQVSVGALSSLSGWAGGYNNASPCDVQDQQQQRFHPDFGAPGLGAQPAHDGGLSPDSRFGQAAGTYEGGGDPAEVFRLRL